MENTKESEQVFKSRFLSMEEIYHIVSDYSGIDLAHKCRKDRNHFFRCTFVSMCDTFGRKILDTEMAKIMGRTHATVWNMRKSLPSFRQKHSWSGHYANVYETVFSATGRPESCIDSDVFIRLRKEDYKNARKREYAAIRKKNLKETGTIAKYSHPVFNKILPFLDNELIMKRVVEEVDYIIEVEKSRGRI